MILVIQEAYWNIRFWYDVDHYLTPCIALAACFYWFYVKHFELQLLYEMCYINKILLTTTHSLGGEFITTKSTLQSHLFLLIQGDSSEISIMTKSNILHHMVGWGKPRGGTCNVCIGCVWHHRIDVASLIHSKPFAVSTSDILHNSVELYRTQFCY